MGGNGGWDNSPKFVGRTFELMAKVCYFCRIVFFFLPDGPAWVKQKSQGVVFGDLTQLPLEIETTFVNQPQPTLNYVLCYHTNASYPTLNQ